MICEKTVGSSHVQVLIINWLNLSTMLSKIIIILIIEWYGAINKFQAMPFHLLACFFIELEDNTGDVMLHDNANSLLVTPCLININGKKKPPLNSKNKPFFRNLEGIISFCLQKVLIESRDKARSSVLDHPLFVGI